MRAGAGLLTAPERQEPLQDVAAFEVSSEVPEQGKRAGHLQRLVDVTVRAAEPGECGAHVRLFLSEPGQRVALPVATQRELGGEDLVVEVAGVPGRDRHVITCLGEPFRGVLAQRLEHPVPGG